MEEYEKIPSDEMIPAIPPADYKGSQSDWMTGLREMGLWDGDGWHGDVFITQDEWWELLEKCEDE